MAVAVQAVLTDERLRAVPTKYLDAQDIRSAVQLIHFSLLQIFMFQFRALEPPVTRAPADALRLTPVLGPTCPLFPSRSKNYSL